MKKIFLLFLVIISLILVSCELADLEHKETKDFTFDNHLNDTEYELLMSVVEINIIEMICEDYCEKYCVTPLDKLSVIEEERKKYCDTPPDNIDDLFAYYKVCFRYQDKEPENFPKDILSNIKNKP